MLRLKVAHITTIDLSLRYLLLNQLSSLQQSGYEVTGVSATGPDVAVLEASGIRHIAIPMTRSFTPWADLISLWHLYRLMRRERFTIVHTHTPKPGLLGQVAARLAGVPIVVNTLHGFFFHEHLRPAARRFYIALEKIAARCSDVILSQNSEDIETAVREGICSPSSIKYLGNGIDIQRFDRSQINLRDLDQKRRELGLASDTPVIGFVGRLVAEKGILELFQAMQIVVRHIPAVRLLLVGPFDTEKPDAVNPMIARDYGLSDICVFTGIRQDMADLYALMNVLVLPSHREGFPRAPMEASAMGVPAVVTDIRGCREAVEHDRNGLIVHLHDSQALAEAIIELLADPKRTSRMGNAGRQMALERFDERILFDKVQAEYRRLLQEKGFLLPKLRASPTEISL
jgi:glycosyltransferase involved in cell wall biosynthesis